MAYWKYKLQLSCNMEFHSYLH